MMPSPDEVVRMADRRPGFNVVSYREIGLPIFYVKPLVTLKEVTEIGPIQEYVLRCLELGIRTTEGITKYLGLSERIVNGQLGDLAYEGLVARVVDQSAAYSLTGKGATVLAEKGRGKIQKEVIPLVVDGITRQVLPKLSEDFYTNKDLEELGISPIPPVPRAPPRYEELEVTEINSALELISPREDLAKKVIQVDALTGRNRLLFRPAIAIAFKSDSGRNISIGFAIDGAMSDEHERIYAKTDEARKSTIFGDVFDSQKRRRDIQQIARELKVDTGVAPIAQATSGKPKDGPKGKDTLTLRRRLKTTSEVRSEGEDIVKTVSVYEHPKILEDAIKTASTRLLIISPWIRAAVVSQSFLELIRKCLARNVRVTIAYGIGREDKQARERDRDAEAELIRLSETYDNFQLTRKGNTHAKVLIKDSEFYVTTSFNWLSFRGDPSQPFREEEGTYVGGDSRVDEYYNRLMKRIAEVVE